MTYKLVTLGCAKNLVDSEILASAMDAAGYATAEEGETVLINTCAFIEDAVKESIDTILAEARRVKQTGGRLVVTGCLVERYGEVLRELLPEVHLFVPVASYGRIAGLLEGRETAPHGQDGRPRLPTRKILTRPPSAYLKVQEGCNNRCTYCTIPSIRGPLVSRPESELVAELEGLLKQGCREITIIGQDIAAYGMDRGTSLVRLLGTMLSVPGDYMLRLLYLHPSHIDEGLLDMTAREERILRYLDVPIQHSEDRILSAMGRKYDRAYLTTLFAAIRSRLPGVVLRTTVMVGFPGETKAEFDGLCAFVREQEFDNLGAFAYSREQGTAAASLKGQLAKRVKQERLARVMEIQREISRRKLKRLVGQKVKVVVEEREGDRMVGRLLLLQAPDVDGWAFIHGPCREGEIREATVTETLDYDVVVRVE